MCLLFLCVLCSAYIFANRVSETSTAGWPLHARAARAKWSLKKCSRRAAATFWDTAWKCITYHYAAQHPHVYKTRSLIIKANKSLQSTSFTLCVNYSSRWMPSENHNWHLIYSICCSFTVHLLEIITMQLLGIQCIQKPVMIKDTTMTAYE